MQGIFLRNSDALSLFTSKALLPQRAESHAPIPRREIALQRDTRAPVLAREPPSGRRSPTREFPPPRTTCGPLDLSEIAASRTRTLSHGCGNGVSLMPLPARLRRASGRCTAGSTAADGAHAPSLRQLKALATEVEPKWRHHCQFIIGCPAEASLPNVRARALDERNGNGTVRATNASSAARGSGRFDCMDTPPE